MRERIRIVISAAIFASVAPHVFAATFQNMDFEGYVANAGYPTSAMMPSWQLVNQLGNGTVLYQNTQPGSLYPFVGYHIGDGPVIGANGVPGWPNPLQGQYSLTLIPYKDSTPFFSTESAAQAVLDGARHGGIAQTADVPAWAQSVWVVTTSQSPFDPNATFSNMNMSFSNQPVTLGAATNSQASTMLASASLSPGLAPLAFFPPPSGPSIRYFAGNISSIAGLTRELKILTARGRVSTNDGSVYFPFVPNITFDMIVFSPLPWAGPAVNVPEPATLAILLTAVSVLSIRRFRRR